MSVGLPGAWRQAVTDGTPLAPVVLVLGGFLTSPPLYGPLARRLRARGAADVVVGELWLMDWLLAAGRGLGPILTRSGRALLKASDRSAALAGGAPVLVIGHSAGGMLTRLLTSPEPFAGRRLNAGGRIGAIVTLGTPHVVPPGAGRRTRVGGEAAAFANRVVPGPWGEPHIGYLAVASRSVTGRPGGSLGQRWARAVYRELAPVPAADGTHEGDGFVPLSSALLPGAPSLILDDAVHGQEPFAEWYGSDRSVDRWWPLALTAWEGALRSRVGAGAGPGFDGSGDLGYRWSPIAGWSSGSSSGS